MMAPRWLLVLPLLAACASDAGVADQNGACFALENLRFYSEELQTDCGPPGPMPMTCQWSVQFAPDTEEQTAYHYNLQDHGEDGTVTCAAARLSVGDAEVGEVNAAVTRLRWYGVTYVRGE